MTCTEFVVGVDGSEPGRAALRWAAAEASRYGARLRVVLAYHWRAPLVAFATGPELRHTAQELADLAVGDAVADAGAERPGLSVSGIAVMGHATDVLLAATHPRAQLVVGAHGDHAVVGQRLAARAPCPVIVVRGRADKADGPVVVGLDGSTATTTVLRAGFDHAAARGCDLVVVRAFRRYPSDDASLVTAEQVLVDLHRAVAPWREAYPGVRVECQPAAGRPGGVLEERSYHAGLVVVGSHGHGGTVERLLGSVSQHLLHHSDCPVLVVRGTTAASGGPA